MHKEKTILITGGAGFIGGYLTKELTDAGHQVIIYDSFINFIEKELGYYPYYLQARLKYLCNKAEIIKGDIRDFKFFLNTLKEKRPEIICHLAAIPLATASNKFSGEAISISLDGLVSVIKAIGAVDFIKRLVYTSSSFVYGDFQYDPADEKHPQEPIDVYGGIKLAGEELVKGFGRKFSIDYTIIRPSAVYGPTDANLRVSQIFVQNALRREPIILHNGGEAKLDFSYVKDTAHGFALAALSEKAKNEIFNITRGEGRSLKEFAQILEKLIPGIKIIEQEQEKEEKRPERGSLDISKAREILGYEPRYSLEDGLKEYVEYVKKTRLFR